jgi:hypothetical protein
MIFDFPEVVWLWNPSVTRDSISLMIYGSLGAVWLSNPSLTRDSSSLMISESLTAVWAVECTYHQRQQFVYDF